MGLNGCVMMSMSLAARLMKAQGVMNPRNCVGDKSGTSVLLYLFDFTVTAAPMGAPQGDPACSGLAEWL